MTSLAARSSSTRPAPSTKGPQSPSSKSPTAGSPKTLSSSDELRSLQATLADLQSKRLNALQLYQEEKSRRVAEAARAASLAAQLDSLESARPPKGKGSANPDEPSSIITTDFFIAEVRSLGLAQGGPSASLTWHCLAMTDLLASQPKIVIVADPSSRVESSRMSGRQRTHSSQNDRVSHAERASNDHVTGANVEELASLNERLRHAEEAAAAAKLSQQRNEGLIADLKEQLDASITACKDLLDTVKEQEDTIEKLS